MESFATVADYEARYGQPDDPSQVAVLLGDASAMIASQPGFAMRDDQVWHANLTAITCAVVHRAVMAGGWAGLSNISQGADGYSASAAIYNPGGDLYLTRNERRAIGLGGSAIGSVAPVIDGWYGSNVGDADG